MPPSLTNVLIVSRFGDSILPKMISLQATDMCGIVLLQPPIIINMPCRQPANYADTGGLNSMSGVPKKTMKVKCVRLLDSVGQEVEFSPWLTLGRVYHVMSIFTNKNGKRCYSIINRHPDGEWPQMGSHQAECFEIVSKIVPSNWHTIDYGNCSDTSPAAWQEFNFYELFSDHDPASYPIYERERDIILHEDP